MATKRRSPLTRERILEQALWLADEHGVEAVTMRKLGQDLGFEAMSLYRHVANKDDVLAGILDLVLAETWPPSPEGDWSDAVRRSAVSVHEALTRHPWATTLLSTPALMRPARLEYMNQLMGRLREAGFSADTTYVAYHVLDAHVFGFSMWMISHQLAGSGQEELVARLMREVPFDDLPYLLEHRDQHMSDGPHRETSAFELGLDLILDGLRKLQTSA